MHTIVVPCCLIFQYIITNLVRPECVLFGFSKNDESYKSEAIKDPDEEAGKLN